MPNWNEKDIEDWVCFAPHEVWSASPSYPTLVGRQITLPSGRRLDVMLLVADPDGARRLVVVEVKVGATDLNALHQLTAYLEEVREWCPSKLKVSGVLLGAEHSGQVATVAGFMPAVELATYQVVVECYGVLGLPPGALRGAHSGVGPTPFDPVGRLIADAARRSITSSEAADG